MSDSSWPRQPLTRRTLLGAAGLGALAAWSGCAVSPSPQPGRRTPIADAPMPTLPDAAPGPMTSGMLASSATGMSHPWLVAYPPGTKVGAHLPVVVMLHGYGDDVSTIELHRYPQVLAQTVAAGGKPYAIAGIYGAHSFWQKLGNHDAGALVATEFLGQLKKLGLNTGRLALSGWSMGGWGALRLACDELHGKLRALVAESTPCYATFSQLPGQGWMTQQEFDTNNFYTRPERLTDLPIYLACGESDGFYRGNVEFADILANTPGVRTPVVNFGPGNHGHPYWQSVAPAQLRFLSQHL